ncbi:MAG TPA: hypothetical protein VMG12_14625 [Polyangiaceae bacterium]|nr:hypothetical protein [Polyangiaceae bacterium]
MPRRRAFCLSLAGPALMLGVASAGAQELSPAPGLSGPIGPPPDVGAHVHDGFYLRIASGFSVLDERLQSDDVDGRNTEARNRGIASLSDLAFGGTVAPGWVVGGGIYSLDLVASTLRVDGSSVDPIPAELDPGLRGLSLIAPFVDWYPNVRGGFHAQAALGLATLVPRVFGHPATSKSDYAAVGGGLLIGTGYEWWIADEWSIGVLTQLGIRVLRGEDESGLKWTHLITNSPSLCVSLTYH